VIVSTNFLVRVADAKNFTSANVNKPDGIPPGYERKLQKWFVHSNSHLRGKVGINIEHSGRKISAAMLQADNQRCDPRALEGFNIGKLSGAAKPYGRLIRIAIFKCQLRQPDWQLPFNQIVID